MVPDCGGPKTSPPTRRSFSPVVRQGRVAVAIQCSLARHTHSPGISDLGLTVEEAEGILAGAALQCSSCAAVDPTTPVDVPRLARAQLM